jgi:RNA polymerase sigma factor (sigma-70 family)
VSTSGATRDPELFTAMYAALRRFAGAVRPVGMDADDLVQEALARTLAVRSLESLDDPEAYLRTAIVRVASNASRGRRRRVEREQRAGAREEVADVYPSDLDDLLRVSPRARAVLFLVCVEHRSYREVATALGCSEAAARAIASRAARQLRRELREEVETGEQV